MKGAAVFYFDWLREDARGRLVTPCQVRADRRLQVTSRGRPVKATARDEWWQFPTVPDTTHHLARRRSEGSLPDSET